MPASVQQSFYAGRRSNARHNEARPAQRNEFPCRDRLWKAPYSSMCASPKASVRTTSAAMTGCTFESTATSGTVCSDEDNGPETPGSETHNTNQAASQPGTVSRPAGRCRKKRRGRQAPPSCFSAPQGFWRRRRSERDDVLCLRTFLALCHSEFDLLAFGQ